jgi:hypothetical protein
MSNSCDLLRTQARILKAGELDEKKGKEIEVAAVEFLKGAAGK